jgi:hypothetical protein
VNISVELPVKPEAANKEMENVSQKVVFPAISAYLRNISTNSVTKRFNRITLLKLRTKIEILTSINLLI